MNVWGVLSSFFGRAAMPAPIEPVPVVQQAEDVDLQELTAQELAEVELAEALWPTAEFGRLLAGRYVAGDLMGGARISDDQDESRAQLEAETNADFWKKWNEQKAKERERQRAITAKGPSPNVKQACETPHADRVAEIIRKVSEMQKPGAGS